MSSNEGFWIGGAIAAGLLVIIDPDGKLHMVSDWIGYVLLGCGVLGALALYFGWDEDE